MDILITQACEVAAIDAEIVMHSVGGYVLSDGTVYPPGLTLIKNVSPPGNSDVVRLQYIDGVFSELPALPSPPLPVPQSVDPLRAIYLLDQMGLSAAYAAWRDAPGRTVLEQETLLRAKVWERDNPVLIAAATAMGITSEQLDQMFIAAQ
jgi:hypothetical protein